ncbi:LPS export ABC transporter permease LptG [Moraxella caviae]|uniref:LPS export ABC transporter permease LptG n=1 Tax=Moraxella caviae TaxID=34060 RepID=A0A1T0A0X3_9GAMM|nr:LPS export ABC transporter permease LptG [Moraxella caviae]OOR89416.1 LPS export ABC transporter permease LptG [Moraxella caviae]STZ09860.1 Lipopolysaccharide export system permease protein lptG [Moraxella caviae]VEW13064.1 Lipopolysaccharide export system permease protein lptG [Moraxella caviae]
MKTMILPRYVMRAALLAMLGAVVGLWLLQTVFAYLSELDNVNDSYTAMDALHYMLYRSPYFLVQFIPTGALLGAVVGLGLLANHSELTSMRAAGLSLYKIIGWTMIPAVLFVLIALGVNQFVLPIANQKAEIIKSHIQDDKITSVHGYWSVVPRDGGQDVVYISYADSDGKLGETKRYRLDEASNLTAALRADSGIYQHQTNQANQIKSNANAGEYTWQLQGVDEVQISTAGVSRAHDDDRLLSLPIAPTDVHLLTKEPEDMSLTDLYAHGQLMQHQDSRSLRHEVAFWQKLLSPFAVLSLVLVASSFVFGSLRSQGLGLRIVLALLTGLLFSYLTDLTGFIALAAGISPLLMALLPIVISTLAGVYLLKRRQ